MLSSRSDSSDKTDDETMSTPLSTSRSTISFSPESTIQNKKSSENGKIIITPRYRQHTLAYSIEFVKRLLEPPVDDSPTDKVKTAIDILTNQNKVGTLSDKQPLTDNDVVPLLSGLIAKLDTKLQSPIKLNHNNSTLKPGLIDKLRKLRQNYIERQTYSVDKLTEDTNAKLFRVRLNLAIIEECKKLMSSAGNNNTASGLSSVLPKFITDIAQITDGQITGVDPNVGTTAVGTPSTNTSFSELVKTQMVNMINKPTDTKSIDDMIKTNYIKKKIAEDAIQIIERLTPRDKSDINFGPYLDGLTSLAKSDDEADIEKIILQGLAEHVKTPPITHIDTNTRKDTDPSIDKYDITQGTSTTFLENHLVNDDQKSKFGERMKAITKVINDTNKKYESGLKKFFGITLNKSNYQINNIEIDNTKNKRSTSNTSTYMGDFNRYVRTPVKKLITGIEKNINKNIHKIKAPVKPQSKSNTSEEDWYTNLKQSIYETDVITTVRKEIQKSMFPGSSTTNSFDSIISGITELNKSAGESTEESSPSHTNSIDITDINEDDILKEIKLDMFTEEVAKTDFYDKVSTLFDAHFTPTQKTEETQQEDPLVESEKKKISTVAATQVISQLMKSWIQSIPFSDTKSATTSDNKLYTQLDADTKTLQNVEKTILENSRNELLKILVEEIPTITVFDNIADEISKTTFDPIIFKKVDNKSHNILATIEFKPDNRLKAEASLEKSSYILSTLFTSPEQKYEIDDTKKNTTKTDKFITNVFQLKTKLLELGKHKSSVSDQPSIIADSWFDAFNTPADNTLYVSPRVKEILTSRTTAESDSMDTDRSTASFGVDIKDIQFEEYIPSPDSVNATRPDTWRPLF